MSNPLNDAGNFFLFILIALILCVGGCWNRVFISDKIVVQQIEINALPGKDNPQKFKIKTNILAPLDYLYIYTDSMYKPGDTLYIGSKKP
jgi:hypothetical protein